MSIIEDSRSAKSLAAPINSPSAGPDSLNGQTSRDTQGGLAVEGQTSPQAIGVPAPMVVAPAGNEAARTATDSAASIPGPLSGSTSLNGQGACANQRRVAVEGQTSPQAIVQAAPIDAPPAGSTTAPPAKSRSTPSGCAPEGRKTSRNQEDSETHMVPAAANYLLGGQESNETQTCIAVGDQTLVPAISIATSIPHPSVRDQAPAAAKREPAPTESALLADPLLALAADVLADLEKVRIANENRLRQLTRSADTPDKDGETGRGFGLDEAHPDVARLAALVGMLADAEHKATLNLQRVMRNHPLGPWVAAQKGIGEKQGARLLAAIGDPYIRPEIMRQDGTVEPPRPRMVSELWAYCGYHVVPADQSILDTHGGVVSGELNGSGPGQTIRGSQSTLAGVAPKRQRGQHANWSAAAKMRAFLVAESCMKKSGTSHRAVYDATRAKYAEAIHAAECTRCGPKGKPAQPGSPLSDGHKHARALRAVAKEVLRDLWREAKRIHEEATELP